jgi:DNA polymerase (family 10)
MRVMMGRADNRRAAEQFYDLALAMEIQGERWRANSYMKAARSIETQTESVRSISDRNALRSIEGVGESIASKLEEFLATGKIEALEAVRDLLPEDLPLFRDAPSLGFRRVADLDRLLGIRTVDDLLRVIYEGRLADLPDFDEEVQQRALEWLSWKREEAADVPTPYALRSAVNIMNELRAGGNVTRIELAGPARRLITSVANITLLFSSASPDLVVAQFGISPEVVELTMVDREQAIGKTRSGAVAMVRHVRDNQFAWELLQATGAEAHLRDLGDAARNTGLRLSSPAFKHAASEEEIYAHLGMRYVPPDLREGRRPRDGVLTGEQLSGDLHIRCASFDGALRVREMVSAARKRGHRFVCFCDRIGRNMDIDAMDRRNAMIDEVQGEDGMLVLKGAEVDITPDGRLDAPSDLLDGLDLVIASVNTRLTMTPGELEARVMRAMDDPNMDVLGHPTNRVIGLREGSGMDMSRIAERAAERRVALEMNAYPDRLDLSDNDAFKVYDSGAFYSLGTDAAYPDELDGWGWAVTIARKALLEPGRVLNSMGPQQLKGRAWRK